MTLKTVFRLCIKMCENRIQENPNAGFSCKGEKITYQDLLEELKQLLDWCYPMNTKKLQICTHCYECKHYKKFKKYPDRKIDNRTVMLCELDKSPKTSEHYCGFAVPREGQS